MDIRTIAFYNRPFPEGGAETVTRNLAHYFKSQGLRIIIYTSLFKRELLTAKELEDFTIKVLPDASNECLPINVEFLRNSLNEEQVDVLMIQGSTVFPFEKLYHIGKTRLIYCLHSIPLWEIYDLRNLKSCQLFNPTFIRRMEFIFLRKPVYRFTDKLKRRYLKLYSKIHHNTDRFVTLFPEYYRQLFRDLQKYDHHPDQKKFAAISNPLLPPQEPTHCPKEKIVLFVGRFSHCDKRIDRLLKIWHQIEDSVPGWRLILVGDGPEKENLHKLAKTLKLKNIEFTGYQSDVASFYRRATFVCLTSDFEGFGMCFAEGQQYGAIPVSFDSYAGIRTITRNGEAGILVPPFSKRQYAKRLKAAMLDRECQIRMREKCYQQASEYKLELIGSQWLQLFKDLD